jgi:hypothetical protein
MVWSSLSSSARGASNFFGFQEKQKTAAGKSPRKKHGSDIVPDVVPESHPARTGSHKPRRNDMPVVKKAPDITTREIKLEVPVSELLDDYSQFIDSSADYVVNAVLKKILWRDQDYRKWRDARRMAITGATKNLTVNTPGSE